MLATINDEIITRQGSSLKEYKGYNELKNDIVPDPNVIVRSYVL